MSATRRTILAVMGLAPVGIGSEAFVNAPAKAGDIQTTADAYSNERAAKALEALAVELRRGSIDIISIGVQSDMKPHEIADVHTLTIEFLHKPEV